MPVSSNYNTISFIVTETKLHGVVPGVAKVLIRERPYGLSMVLPLPRIVCNFKKST